MDINKPKIVSLFSGAGGLDIGFEKAGFRTVYATDVWQTACDTLQKNNMADEVFCGDVRNIDFNALKEKYGDIDCLIGGPPCPPYSQTRHYLVGKADGFDDEHAGFAVPEYFRALEKLRPKVFFFENVDGFTFKTHQHEFDFLKKKADELGYNITFNFVGTYKPVPFIDQDGKKIDFVLWQDRSKQTANPPSDCTIPIDNGLINIRVGAVIRKGNQFLMVGNDRQDYLYSVGGRVKFGETAEQAVIREVFEETGTEMEVDHLGFIQENFFYGDTGIKKDKLIYEISYYFYMKVPEDFQPKCESFTDDNSRENLVWVTTDCKQILYPEFFRTELEDPKPYVIHIVTDERQAGEGKKDHGTV